MNIDKVYLDDLIVALKKHNTDYVIQGENPELYFTNISPALEVKEDSLDWINLDKHDQERAIDNSRAGIIICSKSVDESKLKIQGKCLIKVDDPKAVIIIILNEFFSSPSPNGIHPTSFIHTNARVGKNVFIGPFTYLGDITVGDNSIIYGNCHIYDGVFIGENVIIHAGTVIGADGFGYIRDNNGRLIKFPHIGGVVINNTVEIGANTCIDKGALGDTIIEDSVKIDNLVQIAHNVKIGKNTAILGNSSIAGSTIIGENCWIAPHVIIKEHLLIGNNVFIGMASSVNTNIGDNQVWLGNPAIPVKEYYLKTKKK